MSYDEIISPSKLLYTRDFLLRYSIIHKEEPEITDKLTPVMGSPKPTNMENNGHNTLKKSSTAAGGSTTNTSNTSNTSFRTAITPNPRKSSAAQLVYSQKENLPTQTPVKIGAESFATPARKALAVRPFRSPLRKTWVAAANEFTGQNSSMNFSDVQREVEAISGQQLSTQSLPMVAQDLKTINSPALHVSAFPFTPSRSISTASEPAMYLSPKATPFRSPLTSSPGSKYSPSKSPARPISPLDEQRLAQRQKQIDYGYRTVGYLRYRLLVTKDQRKSEHPRTPKKTQGCSKRSWDGQLKKWRRDLHLWDPDNTDAFKALLNSDLVVSIIAANPELAEIVDIVREKMDNPSLDYEDFDESSSDNYNIPNLPDNGYIIEKKLTPQSAGEDVKLQSKVARTLVF